MTFKQLEYFMTISRTLNYTEAAKQLYVSQPALSRSIAALEEEIGVELFTRNRHNVELTPSGIVLYNAIPQVNTNLSHAIMEAQQIAKGQTGSLLLGILDGLPLLAPIQSALNFFQNQYQSVDIKPVCLNMEESVKAIHAGEIDILYAYDTSQVFDDTLSALNLSVDRFAVAVSSRSVYAESSKLHLKDLDGARLFFSGTESSFETHRWREICAEYGFLPRIVTVVNPSSQMFCVEQNFGVSLLPSMQRMINNLSIQLIPLIEVIPLTYNLKWRQDHKNPAITLFLDIVKKALSKSDQSDC